MYNLCLGGRKKAKKREEKKDGPSEADLLEHEDTHGRLHAGITERLHLRAAN